MFPPAGVERLISGSTERGVEACYYCLLKAPFRVRHPEAEGLLHEDVLVQQTIKYSSAYTATSYSREKKTKAGK